jgi:two-component system response regulator HydG
VLREETGRAALRRVHSRSVSVLLVSSDLPDMQMSIFLDSLRRAGVTTATVVYGRTVNAEDAVSWMKTGVVDIVLQPDDPARIREAVSRAFTASTTAQAPSPAQAQGASAEMPGMLYRSKVMDELVTKVRRIAPVKVTVLVTGESGTGKDLLSRQIHALSGRTGPYMAINCAAIPETLLEDELFGHERGAFTGAERSREGRFEAASGGTLLLDEIGEMSHAIQVKLLRVLEEEQVTRLGGNRPVPTDVRLIAATNSNLAARVRDGSFRQDLYYRLKVIELYLPPLRTRRQDIPILATAFVREAAEKHGIPVPGITPGALAALAAQQWPGNVRQLRNLMESIVITAGPEIGEGDLPPEMTDGRVDDRTLTIELPRTLGEIEEMVIGKTLALAGGNRTRAAELLGIGRRTLQRKLDDEPGSG